MNYTFRTLNATDIFPFIQIIRKIGVNKFSSLFNNEDIQGMISDENAELSEDKTIALVLDLVQIVLDGVSNCEDEIFELLERVSDKTVDEIKSFDMVTFTNMLIDFFKKEELKDFMRAVFTAFNALTTK